MILGKNLPYVTSFYGYTVERKLHSVQFNHFEFCSWRWTLVKVQSGYASQQARILRNNNICYTATAFCNFLHYFSTSADMHIMYINCKCSIRVQIPFQVGKHFTLQIFVLIYPNQLENATCQGILTWKLDY